MLKTPGFPFLCRQLSLSQASAVREEVAVARVS
jgi:hypothetical protein